MNAVIYIYGKGVKKPTDFANGINANITVMSDGEHWFHTEEREMSRPLPANTHL